MRIDGIGEPKTVDWLSKAMQNGAAPAQTFWSIMNDQGVAPSPSAPSSSPQMYTVKRGDTLWGICARTLARGDARVPHESVANAVDRLARANGIKNANRLAIGQQIDLSVFQDSVPRPSFQVAAEKTANLNQPNEGAPLVSGNSSIRRDEPGAQGVASIQSARKGRFLAIAQSPRTTGGGAASPVPPWRAGSSAAPAPLAALARDARTASLPVATTATRDQDALGGAARPVDITRMLQSILNPQMKPEALDAGFGRESSREAATDSPWRFLVGAPARLTSEFGLRKDPFNGELSQHDGIDLAASAGSAVYPYEAGRVRFAGWKPGYGKVVIVSHADGLETVYGHASKTLVRSGQRVAPDMPIAEVGSTGRSTGAHLHFEMRRDGAAFDPVPLLSKRPSLKIAEVF